MREASALGILYSAAAARALGISSSDLECLDVIAAQQPVTAGALAAATGLTTGAITGVVDRLETAGFVRRVRPEADRRKVLISTTDAFLAEVVPLFEPMRRLQSAVVERHGAEQLQTVANFMTLSLQAAREAIVEISQRPGKERPRDRSRR
ncbi:hypothetical protein VQ02_29455 [Methylobacterium variabile]|uniref:HTH marR-type domain-containing protein n=2 Tax=Methylobacterium variabile TaxID=298794 RepID=A0A0J6UTR5_9HYPH|nr:hypothetical protein VQ02_29455 [Methylobacterium variabile]